MDLELFYQRLSEARRAITFTLATLVLSFFILTSQVHKFTLSSDTHLWVIHLTLELLSIFVSVSVVAIVFQRLDKVQNGAANIIVFGYTGIALLDFIHAISFSGMPVFVTESSMEKAIFFWLAARVLELLTMAGLAIHLVSRCHKFTALVASILTVLAISYVGLFHRDLFPLTYVAEVGVTEFKSHFEYVLFIGNLLLTMVFLAQYNRRKSRQQLYFAGSAYCMALCALSLTSYSTPSDFSLFFGHVMKIFSAIFIYAAIYWTELKRPYLLAKQADAKTLRKEQELEAILANIPMGIARFNQSEHCIFANEFMANMPELLSLQNGIKTFNHNLPPDVRDLIREQFDIVFSGKKLEFNYQLESSGQILYREVICVPELDDNTSVHSIICLFVDTTEKVRATLGEAQALNETRMLRKALDEHAIVAFTDAKGVITSLNDKFCEISQYSKEELIGQTHRLINSGVHTADFFRDMWKSISKGKVWHGEVCNRTKNGSLYWVNTTIVPFLNNQDKPTQYVAIRADITEKKLTEQEAARLAYYDDLTSLPNRRLFSEKLEKLAWDENIASSFVHGLMLIDLDNFKGINDSVGHNVGDEILKQVAIRLQQMTETTQIVARLGADEFVLLCAGTSESKLIASLNASLLAEQARTELAKPYLIADQTISMSCSIGITLFTTNQFVPSECLKQADVALYQSKALGKNQVSFFDPELQITLNRRNLIHAKLKDAIQHKEFRLHYQPIYNSDKVIVAVEALIRWESPDLGFISPAEFIPIAEQSTLIIDIGHWVLSEACQQLASWKELPHQSSWTLAVNVSARQIQRSDFVDTIKHLLLETKADPRKLKIEITESMLQGSVEQTIRAMSELKELGILFSLDDFGTGYSSLSYLTKLPINTLKIDKSFVDKMIDSAEDAAVVKTILSLAAALKLDVVAEGVETENEFAFLSDSGCPYFQGYLLSKPLPHTALQLLCSS